MAVLSVVTNPTGLVGVGNYLSASQLPSSVTAGPSVIYINTNDTFTTVTTANYLTPYKTNFGNVFAPGQMAAVYTTDQGTVWLQVTISGSNVSLVEPAVGGFVTVPTVANQIAYATNALGALGAAGLATALFNNGNISAGKSGTSGALFSFPGTALRGSLKLAATASTGDTVTTITNAAQAAARTYTIPDAGVAASSFLMADSAGTQTIATGNLSLTLGSLTVAAGNIAATLGSVSAGTTVTGGTGITATTGAITATAGALVSGSVGGGFAGAVTLFSNTAANGSLRLLAVGNAGNFATTISDLSTQSLAQTVTIPDGGVAASNFLISNSAGTQTIATGSLSLTLGSVTAAAGNLAATLGSVSAGTTVTAGTGISSTTGNIAATAGNVEAGSSGAAGTLISFPATAGNGTLILAGANAGGAFNTTISNGTMGQSSVYTVPDVANAAGRFLVAATATPFVSGNIPQASGTGGLMVDSGVSFASLAPVTASVTMNAATVNGAFAAPVQLIAGQVGKAIMVLAAQIITEVAAPFADGGVAVVQYGNTANGAGTPAIDATTPAAEITAAASQIYTQYGLATATVTATAGVTGLGIFFSNQTGAFTGGVGSTVTIVLQYMVVPAV